MDERHGVDFKFIKFGVYLEGVQPDGVLNPPKICLRECCSDVYVSISFAAGLLSGTMYRPTREAIQSKRAIFYH